MDRSSLIQQIKSKASCLCIGLDLDPARLPGHLSSDKFGWLEFNRSIIDATKDLCVAYKPNWAFYEALGGPGMETLKATIDFIGKDHLIIADAKRGDIGNTSERYAKAVYDVYDADAITVAPYMGVDSLRPFQREGKWMVALVLTSNPGSEDFQKVEIATGSPLYEVVLEKLAREFKPDEMMFVVGATHPDQFSRIREIAPNHFLLVPGVGAQGGSLEGVLSNGMTRDIGLLINSSRSIIYAGDGRDFAERARQKASAMQEVMSQYIS